MLKRKVNRPTTVAFRTRQLQAGARNVLSHSSEIKQVCRKLTNPLNKLTMLKIRIMKSNGHLSIKEAIQRLIRHQPSLRKTVQTVSTLRTRHTEHQHKWLALPQSSQRRWRTWEVAAQTMYMLHTSSRLKARMPIPLPIPISRSIEVGSGLHQKTLQFRRKHHWMSQGITGPTRRRRKLEGCNQR